MRALWLASLLTGCGDPWGLEETRHLRAEHAALQERGAALRARARAGMRRPHELFGLQQELRRAAPVLPAEPSADAVADLEGVQPAGEVESIGLEGGLLQVRVPVRIDGGLSEVALLARSLEARRPPSWLDDVVLSDDGVTAVVVTIYSAAAP